MYFPPINFAVVQEGLYRSGLPSEVNFPFLERLNLRTIVYLFPEDGIRPALEAFIEDQGIELYGIGEGGKSLMLPEETIIQALNLIVDGSKYPLLVTCATGRHRTGTVIACLRKLQRWNLTSIFEEYRRFTKHTARVQNEQFIELFDTDLVLVNKENAPGFLRE